MSVKRRMATCEPLTIAVIVPDSAPSLAAGRCGGAPPARLHVSYRLRNRRGQGLTLTRSARPGLDLLEQLRRVGVDRHDVEHRDAALRERRDALLHVALRA